MKKIGNLSILLLLFMVVFSSCEKEVLKPVNTVVNLTFKDNDYSLEITSTKPLEIQSSTLKVIHAVNPETKQIGYMVVKREKSLDKGVEPGYFFDGDCFIYGTWYIDDNTGDGIFVAGSVADQYVNNRCGYSDVA